MAEDTKKIAIDVDYKFAKLLVWSKSTHTIVTIQVSWDCLRQHYILLQRLVPNWAAISED